MTAYLITHCILSCDALNIQPPTIRRHHHRNLSRYLHSPMRQQGYIRLFSPYSTSPFHTSCRNFSLGSGDASALDNKEIIPSDLHAMVDLLKTSYDVGETDRVQDVIISNSVLPILLGSEEFISIEQVASHLIGAAVEAASAETHLNRGALSGILNSILACCCAIPASGEGNNVIKYPELAWGILKQMDDMHSRDERAMVSPDLVTLSMVYYSCHLAQHSQATSKFCTDVQSTVLQRARKLAKKSAGSSRRKALAAERRKKALTTSESRSSDLQGLYGPDIAVLHEDDDIIAISKPSGMAVYHNKKTGAGKLTASRKKQKLEGLDISLEDALLDMAVPLSTLNPTARGIVHRLDRGTSGAIILAKNDDAHLRLVALFFLRRVKKKYLALVPAVDSEIPSTGIIDSVVDGRPASSKYRVIRTYADILQSTQLESKPAAVLLQVETLTGRKHQVRVHCATGLGCPIFLDPLYSSGHDETNKINTLPSAIRGCEDEKEHFFLHAETIEISDLDVHVNVSAPIPQWWGNTLDQLKELERI